MKFRVLSVLSCIVLFIALFGFRPFNEYRYEEQFKNYFSNHALKLMAHVQRLDQHVRKPEFNVDTAKKYLSLARMQYKSIEGFVIYFLPGDARLLNRPIILEMHDDDEISEYIDFHGFQYVESLLYSDSVNYLESDIRMETGFLYSVVKNFPLAVSMMEFKDRDIFEAMQKQLVKHFMLALAEFETMYSRTGVLESIRLLDFYKEFFSSVIPNSWSKDSDVLIEFSGSIDAANSYLASIPEGQHPDFFFFYANHYIPVSEKLSQLRYLLVDDNSYQTTAINFQNRSIFDPHAFNSNFFLPAKNYNSKKEVVELGRVLFFDPALSANNLRACASCHQPNNAFTDGLPKSMAFDQGKFLSRNAPTIINAVLQRRLFQDGRAFTFQDQAGQVMNNPLEMHSDFSQVAAKLKQSPGYNELFKNAFGGTEDTLISNRSILNALSEYERTLIGMNSRFDKTITGRANLLSEDEKNGFNIFMGKGNCASCHFIPLFNGLMPPDYVETEWEILGTPILDASGNPKLDPDKGRANVLDVEIFRHAFKTPTMRNIELTAPYMHNGVFGTLEEVIDFYDAGGGTGHGYEVPFQTLSSDSLKLTSLEKAQLIAFLKSLTDTAQLTSKPKSLPAFPGNAALNARAIGGQY